MRRAAAIAVALLAMAPATGCHRGQVRLHATPASDEFVWRKLVTMDDLRPLGRGLLFTIEPPIGYSAAREQPLDDFMLMVAVRWNDAVAPLAGHFAVLRDQHNAAHLAVSEFEARARQLHRAINDLKERRNELDIATEHYRTQRDSLDRLRYEDDESVQERRRAALDAMRQARQAATRILEQAKEYVEKLGPTADELDIVAEARP